MAQNAHSRPKCPELPRLVFRYVLLKNSERKFFLGRPVDLEQIQIQIQTCQFSGLQGSAIPVEGGLSVQLRPALDNNFSCAWNCLIDI